MTTPLQRFPKRLSSKFLPNWGILVLIRPKYEMQQYFGLTTLPYPLNYLVLYPLWKPASNISSFKFRSVTFRNDFSPAITPQTHLSLQRMRENMILKGDGSRRKPSRKRDGHSKLLRNVQQTRGSFRAGICLWLYLGNGSLDSNWTKPPQPMAFHLI